MRINILEIYRDMILKIHSWVYLLLDIIAMLRRELLHLILPSLIFTSCSFKAPIINSIKDQTDSIKKQKRNRKSRIYHYFIKRLWNTCVSPVLSASRILPKYNTKSKNLRDNYCIFRVILNC